MDFNLSEEQLAFRDVVMKVPKGMDMVTAASLPTVFWTAFHALTRLAQLKAGERILIHAAAGGVGLAAIQLAQAAGAEIFATAGRLLLHAENLAFAKR